MVSSIVGLFGMVYSIVGFSGMVYFLAGLSRISGNFVSSLVFSENGPCG